MINDEFLEDKTIWIVELNNGEIVYQDDDRPGIEPPNAWIRLGHYVKEHNLRIVNMKINFRSNNFVLPSDAGGYYFAKGCGRAWGTKKTMQFYIVGVRVGDSIRCQWLRVPELIPFEYIEKDLKEAVPPFYIGS